MATSQIVRVRLSPDQIRNLCVSVRDREREGECELVSVFVVLHRLVLWIERDGRYSHMTYYVVAYRNELEFHRRTISLRAGIFSRLKLSAIWNASAKVSNFR